MRWLIIGDPLLQLHASSDTSLEVARVALEAGHEVWWSASDTISWHSNRVVMQASLLETGFPSGTMPQVAAEQTMDANAFSLIWIRKNPPFDTSYQRLCWILQTCEGQSSPTLLSNPPSTLLRYHEKMIPLQAMMDGALLPHEIVPTCIDNKPEQIKSFMDQVGGDVWITKPWLGFGGSEVKKFHDRDDLINYVKSSPVPGLIQPYLPEVTTDGDRRVFIIDGEYVGDVVRMPKKGDFVANLAYGGSGELRPLEEKALDICRRLGAYLRRINCHFAGADLIRNRISEVNITSPTGLVIHRKLSGDNLAGHLVRWFEKKINNQTK